MNSQWISSVPIVIFSIIAGALSDEFGRVKPLIVIPLIGYFLSGLIRFAKLNKIANKTFFLRITIIPFSYQAMGHFKISNYNVNNSEVFWIWYFIKTLSMQLDVWKLPINNYEKI